MPAFPGMGYPLVPGYESVGRVVANGDSRSIRIGQRVFVPGANCFGPVRGLFGGSAARLVVPENRVTVIDESLGEDGVLLALAATALHAMNATNIGSCAPPQLIVGHGVLGRLLARLTLALGHPPPTVWETNTARAGGARGYAVLDPEADSRRDYQSIYDVSGDASLLDSLIGRLGKAAKSCWPGSIPNPFLRVSPGLHARGPNPHCRGVAAGGPGGSQPIDFQRQVGDFRTDFTQAGRRMRRNKPIKPPLKIPIA